MSDIASHIEILEEGPREGFQSEPASIPTSAKVELIEALAETGLKEINCASFVSPKVMPQMADAEEIATSITRKPGVLYRGMWLSPGGFKRAVASGLDLMATISASASDTFLERNNRRTREEYLAQQGEMIDLFEEAGLDGGPLYVFTAFGCNYEGETSVQQVLDRTADLMDLLASRGRKAGHITLCDTIGGATPLDVQRKVGAVRERWPDQPVALHLHDTRGLGIACAAAGLELGVSRFDSSVGNLGGCPFAGNKAASGNLATEELALLCESMGAATGIDIDKLVEVVSLAEKIVGHPLPSKLAKVGTFQRRTASAA